MQKLFCARKRNFLAVSLCGTAAALTAWIGLRAAEKPRQPPVAVVRSTVDHADRSKFVGARTCIDCHRSEYVSWLKTAHHDNPTSRFEGTENSIDTRYKTLVGNLDLCCTCHSVRPEERFGRRLVETGTSCESCHGAAGGNHGWLNRHAVYGPKVAPLEEETPYNFAARIRYCENAGMIRPARQYAVAKTCFSCHIIGDAVLVDAGHKVRFDDFSLIPYLAGEVRHNFHLDQRRNSDTPTLDTLRRGLPLNQRRRLYLIIEQLARMEVALNYVVGLQHDDAVEQRLADELIGILDDAAAELEEFTEVLLQEADLNGDVLTEERLEPLLAALRESELFNSLDTPTRSAASQAAQIIAHLANQFLAEHDGSRLGALDADFLNDLGDPVGDALEP